MNFKIFWIVFKVRFWLIFFILSITVLSAAVFTQFQPNRYEARTSLVLNFNGNTPFDQNVIPAQLSASYIATQLDIISSQSVALEVVEMLKLDEDLNYKDEFLEKTEGRGSIEEWVALNLRRNLNVQPSRNSRVVDISFTANDPDRAAKLANTFADAYIQTVLKLSMEPAARSAKWFDEQIVILRERLATAQAKLTDYQQEQGIVMLDERLDTETSRLNELSKNYVEAQAKTYDVKSRQLGENHPEYLRAVKHEKSLRNSLRTQKRKFLKIKRQRDQLGVLAREVENQQNAYEVMLKRYYETKLESQFNQTNIAVLNKATPPSSPSSPNVLLNMISSVFLGAIIGFVLAFLLEIFNRKIRSGEDIDDFLDTQLLATL